MTCLTDIRNARARDVTTLGEATPSKNRCRSASLSIGLRKLEILDVADP
jgi:hypothetical protein